MTKRKGICRNGLPEFVPSRCKSHEYDLQTKPRNRDDQALKVWAGREHA